MNDDVRVLIVDDTPEDRQLLRRLLAEVGQAYSLCEAETGGAGLERCRREGPDCVLLDFRLPDQDGLDFIDRLRESGETAWTPVVMLTGQGNETVAAEAMKRGAADYLVKGQLTPDSLHRAIANAIEKAALRRRLAEKQAELERLAVTDDLTGIKNRRAVLARLDEEIERTRRYGSGLSVLLADIDHFKEVNDRFGHLVGDELLRAVAGVMAQSLRASDHVGRYGGEEFLIVLPETGLAAAGKLAERLRAGVAGLSVRPGGGEPVEVTVSVGGAELVESDEDADSLVARADAALYRAKQRGRNQVCLAASGAGGFVAGPDDAARHRL